MNLEETDFISRTKSEIEMDGRNPAFTVFYSKNKMNVTLIISIGHNENNLFD